MYYYFRLQFRLLNRHILDFGLPPWAGYLLGALGFFGFSYFLFSRTELAEYILLGIGWMLQLKLANTRRNGFLSANYVRPTYYKIRLLESLAIAVPILAILIFKGCYISTLLLLAGAMAVVWVNVEPKSDMVLPTPFYRYPFEFLTGFRRSFLLVFFAYFLTVMALWVDNFNLGAFSLLLVFLVSMSFYSEPEDKLYVWIHTLTPVQFLWHKTGIALLYASLLSMPVLLAMMATYAGFWAILLAIYALGCLYLTSIVWSKYANFPQPLLVPQGILLGIGWCLPILLLGIMPFFYKQSVKKLAALLS